MVGSRPLQIALGRYDPWHRTPHVVIGNGKIKFLPGQGTGGQFETTEAVFPSGSRVEYRIQKGDRYFDGDHSQALGSSLLVVQPDGSRKVLASGFSLYVDMIVAARNLKKLGIPFRVVSFYERADGRQVETELSISRFRLSRGLALASSSLWLGVIAGLFVQSVDYVIGIGTVAFAILAFATMRSAASKRAALVQIISTLPIFATAYAVMVLLVRFAFTRR